MALNPAHRAIASAGSGVRTATGAAARPGTTWWRGPAKIKKAELVNMTSQLAIMTRAGVDVASALQSLVRQCKSPALKAVLTDVHESVLAGRSISQSLAPYEQVFDQSFVATISAGEASGRLPDVLGQLAELLRGEVRLRHSIRTMLAYPTILVAVSGTVLAALLLFVLPKFADIFADFEAPLPVITQLLIDLSGELRSRWWIWGPLVMVSLAGLFVLKRSDSGRRLSDRVTLNSPVLRSISRSLLIGRTCRLLGIMLDSGVPLLESMALAKMSVKNSLYRDLFERLEDDVLSGGGLANGMLESEFIPDAASEMIATAEKTGNLPVVTQMVGRHYEEEGEAKLKELVALLEPAITVVMGLLVAVIVMSVMLPLFDLSSAVK